jgi:transcriptional regulator with XRE-family HTH domain
MDFVQIVQDAMTERKVTAYAVCKATGIDSASLSRFLTRKGRLRSDMLSRIFEFLRIEVKMIPENN